MVQLVLLNLFQSSLWLKKFTIFKPIYSRIFQSRPHDRRSLLDIFQNLLSLKKFTIFEQIYCQILRVYPYIGPKNLGIKRPKRSILPSEWGFERCLLFKLVLLSASSLSGLSPILSLASQFTDEISEENPAAYISGPYIGSQFGTLKFSQPPRTLCKDVYFTWGIYGRYQIRALKTLFVGARIGYNDNAHKISRDIESLLSITYLFRKRVTLSLNPGFVYITNRLENKRISECHPAFTASLGLGICQRFHPFVSYRGVFAYNNDRCHIPTFHGFTSGLEVRF
jgi:hypothetical protein